MRLIATCKLGLESVVAGELRALGIEEIEVQDARIFFEGDENTLARALLWLRAAERVLLEVASFPARTFDELFEGVKALDWKQYIPRDAFIHVNGKSAKSTLFSVSDCQRITKKAIVDNLLAAYRTHSLPETGAEVIVEVGMLRDTATLALDACGAGLSRRGYRTYNVEAPLSETLGAGLILLSRYRGGRPFVDPMCGSGTLPIEAAMIAQNRAPGMGRSFAAETWGFLPAACFTNARLAAREAVRNEKVEILGADIDERSVKLAKQHAKKAGVMVDWAVQDVRNMHETRTGGVLIANPPYGARMMSEAEAGRLYRDMRTVFDQLSGWGVHIFSAYREFERVYGKRAHKRRKLSNGGMVCTYYQYFPGKDTD
ncbi:class I SAM-dependent RNA methyltransferase [Christensenellaceae bacterium OttesenSCG-928-L17]|nr:class I SAM-dependent RNA methyltransferase [Christensenellaceae bacterium OttesenSCG-928-L17]